MKVNKQEFDEKMKKFAEEFKSMLTAIIDQTNTHKSFPIQKDSPNPTYPTNVVPPNRSAPPLDIGKSTKLVACRF